MDELNSTLPLSIDYSSGEFRKKYNIKEDTIKDRLDEKKNDQNNVINNFFNVSSESLKAQSYKNYIFQYDIADLLAIIFKYGIQMPEITKVNNEYYDNKKRKVNFNNIFEYNKLLIKEIEKTNPVTKYLIQSTDEYEYAYSMTHFLSEIVDKIKIIIYLSLESDTTKDKSIMLNRLNNNLNNIIDECLITSTNEYDYIKTNSINKTYKFTDLRSNIKHAYDILLRRKTENHYNGCYNDDIFKSIDAINDHILDNNCKILLDELSQLIENINDDIDLATVENFSKVKKIFNKIKGKFKNDTSILSELENHINNVAIGSINNDNIDIDDEILYSDIIGTNRSASEEIKDSLRSRYNSYLQKYHKIDRLEDKYHKFTINFNKLYTSNVFNEAEYKSKLIKFALSNYIYFDGVFNISYMMDNTIISDFDTYTKHNAIMYLSNLFIKYNEHIIEFKKTCSTTHDDKSSILDINTKYKYIKKYIYRILQVSGYKVTDFNITKQDAKVVLESYEHMKIINALDEESFSFLVNRILQFEIVLNSIDYSSLDVQANSYNINTNNYLNIIADETVLSLYNKVLSSYIMLLTYTFYLYAEKEAETMVCRRKELENKRISKINEYKSNENNLYNDINRNIDRAIGLIWSDLNKNINKTNVFTIEK